MTRTARSNLNIAFALRAKVEEPSHEEIRQAALLLAEVCMDLVSQQAMDDDSWRERYDEAMKVINRLDTTEYADESC